MLGNKHRIQLEIKNTYSIEHVISELKRFPETKLGHVVMNREHLYKIGVKELEEIQKKIKTKEAQGKDVYVRVDDEYRKISDITILTIELMPFYEEYVAKMAGEEEAHIKAAYLIMKYGDFYRTFHKYISENIVHFKDRRVQASMADIIAEAQKDGVIIENNTDFFSGMASFFKNEGMYVTLDFNVGTVVFQR